MKEQVQGDDAQVNHALADLSAPVCASKRAVAIASTSSIKMMAGAFSLASRNTSLTILGPYIPYILFTSESCHYHNLIVSNLEEISRSFVSCRLPICFFLSHLCERLSWRPVVLRLPQQQRHTSTMTQNVLSLAAHCQGSAMAKQVASQQQHL